MSMDTNNPTAVTNPPWLLSVLRFIDAASTLVREGKAIIELFRVARAKQETVK